MKKTILGLLAFAAIAFLVSGAIAEGVKCGQPGSAGSGCNMMAADGASGPAGCCAQGKDSRQLMAMNTECNMAKDSSGKMGSMCCDKCGKACTPDNKCCDKCCCAMKDGKGGCSKMDAKCCDKCGKSCTPDNKCCDKCCCAKKDSCGKMDSKTCEKCGKPCTCATGVKCCDECCNIKKEGCCKKPGCSTTGASKDATSQDVVVDPVCGMDVPAAGSKYNYEYKGKTYNFCSESCMDRFKKDPSKYIGK